jgi:PKHD-type hydroxylase
MSILITDEFTGGELEIMGEVMEIEKGDAVIFPSYLPHSVAPVKTGSRLSLVSWLYGPQWK